MSLENGIDNYTIDDSKLFLSLNAIDSNICVIDENGQIVFANKYWKDFGEANGLIKDLIGENYLVICGKDTDDENTQKILEGIKKVISGEEEIYENVYPCHGPSKQRWFQLKAINNDYFGNKRIIVIHKDITSDILSKVNKGIGNNINKRVLEITTELVNGIVLGCELIEGQNNDHLRKIIEDQARKIIVAFEKKEQIESLQDSKIQLFLENMDIKGLLESTIINFEKKFSEKNIKVITTYNISCDNNNVKVDFNLLGIALSNIFEYIYYLISSIHFENLTFEKYPIQLNGYTIKNKLHIDIIFDGEIPLNIQKDVFEKSSLNIFQEHEMNLLIAKLAIEQHYGRIYYNYTENRSKLKISMPINLN